MSDLSLWLLTLLLLLLPRVLSVALVVARGETAAFGGPARLAAGATFELVLSTLQAPVRMMAHSVFVLGALTGLKLEWKSPPRDAEAPGWGDTLRRVGALALLPLVLSLGLARRVALWTLAPLMVPLALAVPLTVLTGHPRAGRLAQRLGLLRTPEEWRRPRPLARVAECKAFGDLVPARAGPLLPQADAWRLAPVAATFVMALLLSVVPRPGHTPELPALWPADLRPSASWDAGAAAPSVREAEAPRKRVVARNRPARMIDDAVRQRALEAVERALAEQDLPA